MEANVDEWPATGDLLGRLFRTDGSAEAVGWDLPSFLAAYSLHDSALAEVRLDPWAGLLLLVQWDMVWNPQVPTDFDRLVIGIPAVYACSWSQGGWHQTTIAGATSAVVAAAEREQMLADGSVDLRAFQGPRDEILPAFDDPTLTRTTLDGGNWSRLRVSHGGAVSFLCIDAAGRAGPLPKRGRS